MKKRLLSAALALAMVLTLLPLSAFAATTAPTAPSDFTATENSNGIVDMVYYTKDTKVGDIEITQDGWYYINGTQKLYAVGGVVAATGAWTNNQRAKWYATAQLAVDSGVTAFELVADGTISDVKALTSLTVDLNGRNLTWSATISSTTPLTSLTITDRLDDNGAIKTGSVFDGDITVGQDSAGNGKNFTLNLTNVKMASSKNIAIYHVGTGIVNVNNAEADDITVKSVPATSTGTVATSGGKVDLSGSLAKAGAVKVNSTNGGDVDVTNVATKVTSIELTGYGTHLDIVSSKVGAVTVFGTADTTQKAQAAADINVNGYGCVVDSVENTTTPVATTDALTNGVSLDITGNGSVGEVNLLNAAVKVDNGAISDTNGITLASGSLELGRRNATNRSSVSKAVLGSGSFAGSVSVTLYEQGNSSLGAVTEVLNNKNHITVTIPAHSANPSLDNNTITSVVTKTMGNWTKYTIAGGKFTTAITSANIELLNGDLLYEDAVDGVTTYWPSARTDELVAYWETPNTTHATKIIGTDSSAEATVTMYKGGTTADEKAFEFTYTKTATDITIQMPSKVGGLSIVEWNQGSSSTTTWAGKQSYTLPVSPTGDKVEFFTDVVGYTITKVNNVVVPLDGSNPGVEVKLVGNTIQLKGSVSGITAGKNTATIDLRLKTDAGDVDLKAAWVPSTNSLTFSTDPTTATKGAMRLADEGKSIQLTVNNVKYTLQNAGLKVEAVGLNFAGNGDGTSGNPSKAKIVTTSTVYTGTNAQTNNENLAKAMSGGEVDFSDSPAVLEAFGSAIAGIDKAQVDSWRTTAQNQAYYAVHKQNPTTQTQRETTGYSRVVAILYMDVRVSQWSDSATPGSLTAVMTPYMKVEVWHNKDADGTSTTKNETPIVVRTGQPLRALNSEVGEVKVKLPVGGSSYTVTGNVAHQNNTYVYVVAQSAITPGTADFTITHAAANGSGFGTIVLNAVTAPVEVKGLRSDGTYAAYSPRKLYDTIQAAVDDTVNSDQVEVLSPMSQNVPITMSGDARTIYVDTHGNATITNATSSNVVFVEKTAGINYTIQLTRDTAKPSTTEKPIPITVVSATGGSASLSASRADEGDTITVTLTPMANYRVGGVTVTAAVKNSSTGVTTNTTVITTAASANSWRFVVPTGATSVTVTPSFVATSTGVTVTVSNPAVGGTASTSAGTNRVAVGAPVTVTVSPSTGYRTMGLYVTNATATRTGANTFSFNVPAGTANVVVTPRFDRTNGTLFDDVWSYDYFSSAVAWAVGRGITNGDGSVYHFGTGKSCSREDMVTFLWRNAGSPVVTDVRNPFWDVQPGSYYYNAVMWAVKNGVTNGVSANQFGVGRAVTRGEAVTFLYRAAGSPAASTNSGFYDVPSGEYYAKAVTWAVGKGITNGDGSTVRFNPNGYCLREQIVAFMYRNATGTRA